MAFSFFSNSSRWQKKKKKYPSSVCFGSVNPIHPLPPHLLPKCGWGTLGPFQKRIFLPSSNALHHHEKYRVFCFFRLSLFWKLEDREWMTGIMRGPCDNPVCLPPPALEKWLLIRDNKKMGKILCTDGRSAPWRAAAIIKRQTNHQLTRRFTSTSLLWMMGTRLASSLSYSCLFYPLLSWVQSWYSAYSN